MVHMEQFMQKCCSRIYFGVDLFLIYVFWQDKEHLEYSEQPKAIFCKNGRKVYFYFISGKISHD